MEEALKLLKILRDDYIHGELDKDINEAINELEEAMKTKSCLECISKHNCLYHKAVTDPLKTMNEVDYFLNTFYCAEFKQRTYNVRH